MRRRGRSRAKGRIASDQRRSHPKGLMAEELIPVRPLPRRARDIDQARARTPFEL